MEELCCIDRDLMAKTLEPFVHQVSGRAHMLTLDSRTLCKSLSKREWNFYKELPLPLQNFVPNLKGILLVQLENGKENSHLFKSSDIWLLSDPTSTVVNSCNGNLNVNDAHDHVTSPIGRFILSHGGTKERCLHRTFEQTLFKGLERIEYVTNGGFTSHAYTVDKDQEAVTEAVGRNPWSLRQHKREINRTLTGDVLRKEVDLPTLREEVGFNNHSGVSEGNHELSNNRMIEDPPHLKAYLLLEDVTSGYLFPSILDLKIGTQLDRPDCSQEKKDKHFNLVQKSSTGSLGLRVAGMQVYQVDEKHYLCRDKYYGRGLSTNGFNDTLRQFLHNGQRIVTEVIPPIVDRLIALRKVLEKQNSFRFHASSVLIMYEGAQADDLDSKTNQAENKSTDDDQDADMERSFQNINSESKLDGEATRQIFQNRANCNNNNSSLCRAASVHMIDFAHSTFQGFLDDKTLYEGPDKDCLFALDNLVSVLNEIKRNSNSV